MNKAWETKITKHAKTLVTPAASQCRELLEPCYKTALKVWDAFGDGKPHDAMEIADCLGLHYNTVRHILRSLQAGGVEFTESPTLGWQPVGTGRPREKMHRKRKDR